MKKIGVMLLGFVLIVGLVGGVWGDERESMAGAPCSCGTKLAYDCGGGVMSGTCGSADKDGQCHVVCDGDGGQGGDDGNGVESGTGVPPPENGWFDGLWRFAKDLIDWFGGLFRGIGRWFGGLFGGGDEFGSTYWVVTDVPSGETPIDEDEDDTSDEDDDANGNNIPDIEECRGTCYSDADCLQDCECQPDSSSQTGYGCAPPPLLFSPPEQTWWEKIIKWFFG